MKTKKSRPKKFISLSPAEREREVSKFDREIDVEKETRPLSAKQQAVFDRWRGVSKPSRKQEITVKLDAVTLRQCKAYAEKHHLSLSEVINLGLASVFQFAE